MIKEIVKPKNDKLIIDLPKDYIGQSLEVLIFKYDENIKNDYDKDKLLEEFENITKNISSIDDKSIDLTKIDDEMYNALLWYKYFDILLY